MIDNIPVLFENKEQCCACGACVNACPKDAISMIEDEYGYLYPNIDATKCIKCEMCKKVCSYQNKEEIQLPINTFVAISKDINVLRKSASGGVFGTLANAIINDGGYAVGAAFDNGFYVKHIFAANPIDLKRIQGSKYTQSNVGLIYRDIKKRLNEVDKTILFSGCPCQVAGLKSYLGKEYKNLLTIDLICHGVPSNKMFHDYIESLEKRENISLKEFCFRDKDLGWGIKCTALTDDNKKISPFSTSSFSYLSYFLDGYIYRENCYKCKYASRHRPGDISIGDYWGIEKEHSDLVENGCIDTERGVSVLIVNTEKGRDYLKQYEACFDLFESSYEKAAVVNTQLTRPTECNKNKRVKILKVYSKNGWEAVESDFQRRYFIFRLKRKTKK